MSLISGIVSHEQEKILRLVRTNGLDSREENLTQMVANTSKLIGLTCSVLVLAVVAGGCSSGGPTPEQNTINAANLADQAASRADAAAQRAQAAAGQAQSAASRTEQASQCRQGSG
jgi:hypothetical protein